MRLRATGPDTALDGVFEIRALRCENGVWEPFERVCRPFEGEAMDRATARMLREFGVRGRDLESAPHAREAWVELEAFLGERVALVADAESFAAWAAHLGGGRRRAFLGLDEALGLLRPGALRDPASDDADDPEAIREVFARAIAELLELDPLARSLLAAAWVHTWRGLDANGDPTAEALGRLLAWIERPSAWVGPARELFESSDALVDGGLTAALDDSDPVDVLERCQDAMAELEPAWEALGRLAEIGDTVPPDASGPAGFTDEDRTTLDDVFQVHLPAVLAGPDGAEGRYREGQHQVAREVAATLGGEELLLVHAPTGTGKTLAHLVPALLWSTRHSVRVGISTYTRALQEQAMQREVPRALEALRRAGFAGEPKVTVLKGRENYLCWRGLSTQVPAIDDAPERWLAWTMLLAFALRDPDGDLDRFPTRIPLASRSRVAVDRSRLHRELGALVRAVRSQSGCCSIKADKRTCAAEVARARSERAHVVITNHSFALARQDFFQRIVFDECEHLHDQAHAAYSHIARPSDLRAFLGRLREPGNPHSKAPLDALERVVPEGSSTREKLDQSIRAWFAMLGALDRLERSVLAFTEWREAERRERDDRDDHSLLREFVEDEVDGSEELVAARTDFCRAGTALDAGLSQLAGELDAVPIRGKRRLRRSLELARGDLAERLEAVEAWIPLIDGGPVFFREVFHDVERDARGKDVLAARVLLPNEFLGRHYYPQVSSAVLISATTWLGGGFEAAKGYLGLDRAEDPAPNEDRVPSVVRCVRAPDPFDYSRVLVCAPNDAPSYRGDRQRFDTYVREFIAHLAERTRGRMLVLFTNADDVRRTGEALSGFFRARRIPFWFQNMPGLRKEELASLFRARVDSVLLGVDTFWYGADFPGETLEYLVIVKLPYGVPDRYHHAQCAVLGQGGQRKRIYLPRALAKVRQGFGRLMRRESDRGCVFFLDGRVLERRHAHFLAELPVDRSSLEGAQEDAEWSGERARLLVDDTESCLRASLAHMDMLSDVARRGLALDFAGPVAPQSAVLRPAPKARPRPAAKPRPTPEPPPTAEFLDIPTGDLPF